MAAASLDKTDYVIGANDPEIRRLGLQHSVWRERALGAWRRAQIRPGMTVLDMGSGPGHASFDLAQIVGPTGRVIAVDRSPLFLEALRRGAAERGLGNIDTLEADLADLDLPENSLDAVWSRWVLSFTPEPGAVLARVARALKPGGDFVCHEYGDYALFSVNPAEPVMARLVAAVEASWRAFGGDPDIGKAMPALFRELGWTAVSYTPHVLVTRPGESAWRWPQTFVETGVDRLVELGFLSAGDAADFQAFFAHRNADPDSLMIAPMVLECIARG